MIKRINEIVRDVNNAQEEALLSALEAAAKQANEGALNKVSALLQEHCESDSIRVRIYAYDTLREDCLFHVLHKGRVVMGLGFHIMDEQTLERIKAFVKSRR